MIVNIVDRLPCHKALRYNRRNVLDIHYLVIHHAGAGNLMTSPEVIARYHVGLGWPGMGYHYYITGDGVTYMTNYLTTVSYHIHGLNQVSVGICFAGDFTKMEPTEAQIASGRELISCMLNVLGKDASCVIPHSAEVATLCPGGDWWKRLLT